MQRSLPGFRFNLVEFQNPYCDINVKKKKKPPKKTQRSSFLPSASLVGRMRSAARNSCACGVSAATMQPEERLAARASARATAALTSAVPSTLVQSGLCLLLSKESTCSSRKQIGASGLCLQSCSTLFARPSLSSVSAASVPPTM